MLQQVKGSEFVWGLRGLGVGDAPISGGIDMCNHISTTFENIPYRESAALVGSSAGLSGGVVVCIFRPGF